MKTNKSKAFDKLLLSLVPESPESPEPETCTSCEETVGNFWNGVAQREYEESGLCQDCQDGE